MKFNQMKFQKAVVISAFVVAILTFVYAVSFATPFYTLSLAPDAPDGVDIDVGSIRAFFTEVQPFNRTLTALSVVFILVSLLLFLSFSQKRRRYYLFNYIAAGCYSVASLGFSIFSFINLADLSAKYSQFEFEAIEAALQARIEYWGELFPDHTFEGYIQATKGTQAILDYFTKEVRQDTIVFLLGFILFALTIVVSGLLIFNCIWKLKATKAEDAMYAEEDSQIRAAQEERERALLAAMNEEAE